MSSLAKLISTPPTSDTSARANWAGGQHAMMWLVERNDLPRPGNLRVIALAERFR
jgi:hypothetical protein